ncbi:hypothetical protein K502DRAFT_363967 [Neoconidiobolus thromboides FSU 785]|nr:hypothetical protein K502DRAFT_363967 [Neoconidiobolus thromboides FSU 785]
MIYNQRLLLSLPSFKLKPPLVMSEKFMHRCDHCYYRSKGCDRKVPKCSYCKERNLECTISRQIKRTNKLYKFEDKISTFKINPFKSTNIRMKIKPTTSKQVSPKNNDDVEGDNLLVQNKKDTSHGIKSNLLKVTSAILVIIPIKGGRDALLTFLQYPPMENFNNGVKLIVSISTQMSLLLKKRYYLNLNTLSLAQSYPYFSLPLIFQSLRSYFSIDHHLLPLFNIKRFDFNSLNYVTKLIIIASGLNKAKKDDNMIQAMSYCENEIFNHFRHPHRLKYNLETVQCVVILLMTLRNFKWVLKLTNNFLYYLANSTTILGLNLACPKMNLNLIIERRMVYNAIYFVLMVFSSASYYCYPRFYKQSKRYKLANSLNQEPFNSASCLIDISQHLSILFNEFLGDYSYYYYEIVEIKVKVVDKIMTFDQVYKRLNIILNNFTSAFISYQFILSKMSQTKVNDKISVLLNAYLSHAKFLFHYIKFFSFSLSLYYQSDPTELDYCNFNLPLSFDPQYSKATFIQKLLNEALQAIKNMMFLPVHSITHDMIGALFQCVIFIMRYRRFGDMDKISQLLLAGKSKLLLLSSSPYFSNSAKVNLAFLEVAEKLIYSL